MDKEVWMASAEDTIIQKLRWYKLSKVEKHLVDAAFVYQVQKENLDEKYLEEWIKLLKVGNLFKLLKKVNLEEHF